MTLIQVIQSRPRHSLQPPAARGRRYLAAAGAVLAITIATAGVALWAGPEGPPADSPLRRAILADSPQLYWPLEDGSTGSGLPDGAPLAASGSVDFTTIAGPAGSRPLPARLLDDAGALTADVAMAAAGTYQVEFTLAVDTPSVASGGSIVAWSSPGGATLTGWNVSYVGDGRALSVDTTDAAEVLSSRLGYFFEPGDTGFHYYAISVLQSGADVVVALSVDGVTRGSTIVGSATVVAPQGPVIGRPGSAGAPSSGPATLGHVAFFNRVLDPAGHYSAMLGSN